MAEVRYVCPGSCGWSVSEKEYDKGKTICQAPACEKHGEPLEKKLYCPECGIYFDEDAAHTC
ncbi:MAG: hypothetical protein GF408_00800 [Candidatus Omnitrophica bacterium]|nr:hypothetical protein [Candidatus Omnitrophota bacterium]